MNKMNDKQGIIMASKALKQFRDETIINPEGYQFEIKCLKCKSKNIKVQGNFDYCMGSEYTGIYGETTTVLFKCLDCGNAFSFVVDEF